LLPVGIPAPGGRGETERLRALCELTVEVRHKGMHIIVALCGDAEGNFKVQILRAACADVDALEKAGIGDDILLLNSVDKGLLERKFLDGRKIVPVDVIPVVNLLVAVIRILQADAVERGDIGEHGPAGLQPAVAGNEDGLQHVFVEKAVTHPLANDHIYLGNGKLDFLNLPADQCDDILKSIKLDNFLSLLDDA